MRCNEVYDMCNGSDDFKALYDKLKTCDACRQGRQDLRDLSREGFMYRWHPYSSGDAPFAYIFLAWEPSRKGEKSDSTYPACTWFNEPLQFAIRKFLGFPPGCKNFYITNMAKCSIKRELSANTREFRFTTCEWVLCRELELARTDLHFPVFVSIGGAPADFINGATAKRPNAYGRMFTGRTLHRITHYSPINVRFRFGPFAKKRASEYEQFCATVRKEYTDFVKKECPWHLPEDGRIRDGDLQTLFYWFTEDMRAIREELSGKPQ
jgi:hypothetical protein